jgi:hypothetical protein
MALPDKTLNTILRITGSGATVITGVTNIGGIKVVSTEQETTSLNSPDGFKQFILTVKELQPVSLSGFVDLSQYSDLYDYAIGQDLLSFEVEFPDGTVEAFSAYIMEFGTTETTVEGARGWEAMLRPSGKLTHTSPTPSV